jgi:hypothetical protein
MSALEWVLGQQNRINFVMIDSSGVEQTGLTLTIEISKDGGAFGAAAGTDAEISDGWYTYLATTGEADTFGPVAVKVTAAGAVQQNLGYVVKQRTSLASSRDYVVTDSVTTFPIEGVEVTISTDIGGSNRFWIGHTDILGMTRDADGDKPLLDPGTYYFWKKFAGYDDDQNPDTEVFV